jgi:hypothetical protein
LPAPGPNIERGGTHEPSDTTTAVEFENPSTHTVFEALSCELTVDGKEGKPGTPIDLPLRDVAANTPASTSNDEYNLATDGSTKLLGTEKERFAEGTHLVEMWCEATGTELTVDKVNLLAWSTG